MCVHLQCSDVRSVDRMTVDQCAVELSHATTYNLSLPGDITTVVSLLHTMVRTLSESEAQPPSTMTSQVYSTVGSEVVFVMMSFYSHTTCTHRTWWRWPVNY